MNNKYTLLACLFLIPLIGNAQVDVNDKKNEDYAWIAFYKPNYVLPYYYTQSPYYAPYENTTSGNDTINHTEAKYQLSFQIPVWKNIASESNSLNFGYTQLSYWQVYNHNSFFRETNYSPELFFSHKLNEKSTIRAGALHQSNGAGGDNERSWDRAYVELNAYVSDWMFSIKPWYILPTIGSNNSDIGHFLGHEEIILAYKTNHQQEWSLMARNLESGGDRSAFELAWSFPLTEHLKGYAQLFSGYGQSLIEYNHRTNAIGIGIAFSDWM